MDYLKVSQVAKGNELAPSSSIGEDTAGKADLRRHKSPEMFPSPCSANSIGRRLPLCWPA